MKQILLIILLTLNFEIVSAQAVGIGTIAPHSSSMLEVKSTSKGVVIPRMSSSQRLAIVSPTYGLLVYDSTARSIFMFDGISWMAFAMVNNTIAPQLVPVIFPPQASTSEGWAGSSVSISGNYAIVGAPYHSWAASSQGAAHIYFKNGISWEQQALIYKASPSANDRFGWSVDISGDFAVVGAPYDNSSAGTATIYTRVGTAWNNSGTISGSATNKLGNSVSLSNNVLVVGSPGNNKVIIYRHNGTTWILEEELYGTTGSGFGNKVSVDGKRLAIGDTKPNGTLSLYEKRDIGWVHMKSFSGIEIDALDISSNYAAISDGTAVQLYWFNGSDWAPQNVLRDPAAGNNGFGTSLSFSGNYLIIGCPARSFNQTSEGVAYIFKRNGNSWIQVSIVANDNPADNDFFGSAVGIDHDQFIIGIPRKNNFKGAISFGILDAN